MNGIKAQPVCLDQAIADPGPIIIIEDLDEFTMGRTSTCLCWAGQSEEACSAA
jgi:hypothetical protein